MVYKSTMAYARRKRTKLAIVRTVKRRRVTRANGPYKRKAIRSVSGTFAKKVKAVLNTALEKKFTTRVYNTATIALAITADNTIADVAQGVTDTTRIGEKIRPTSYKINLCFNNTSSNSGWIRYSILKITKEDATANYTSALAWQTDATTGDPATPAALAALTTWGQFTAPWSGKAVTVCYDRFLKIADSTETSGLQIRRLQAVVPMSGTIDFKDATGGATAQSPRYYQLVSAFSPEGTIACTMIGWCKMYYVDA